MERAHRGELMLEALPALAAVVAAVELAEICAHEDELWIGRMHGHAPRRAVQRAGQRTCLPRASAVVAGEQAAGGTRGSVAVAKEYAAAVDARYHRARVLPRRIQLLEMPARAVVLAEVQAAVGRRQNALPCYGDGMHVSGDEAGIGALPVLAAIVAPEDATDLDRRPHRLAGKEDLRDARRPAVDIREARHGRHVELAPPRASVLRCEEPRGSASSQEPRAIFRILRQRPDIAHRRIAPLPTSCALIPAINTVVRACVEDVRNLRMAAQRPHALLEIEARRAVRIHA